MNEKWGSVRLENLYLEPSRNGLNRPKRVRGSGYQMVNMGELFAFDRISSPPMERVLMNEVETYKFSLKPGDLLFARQSLVLEGAGKCSIVLTTPETTTFESHLIRVRLDPSKANAMFYFYYFKSPIGIGGIRSLVNQVAAAGIRGSELARLEVLCLPLPIQRKIAAILSAYDDLVENNIRRIQILEEMAQALYREWFVHFRFPGHEQSNLVESEMGLIPEGWQPELFGTLLADNIGGGWGADEPSEEFPLPAYVIRGTDIPSARHGTVASCPLRYHKPSNLRSRIVQAGDVVFEVSGGSKGQPVGRALLVNERLLRMLNENVICASFCKRLRMAADRVSPELLYLHLLEIYSNGMINKYQVQSTGITNFKFTHFVNDDLVVLPLPEIQARFTSIVAPMLDSVCALGEKNALLRQTRNLLLPKLISGEVAVDDLDIDTGEANSTEAEAEGASRAASA